MNDKPIRFFGAICVLLAIALALLMIVVLRRFDDDTREIAEGVITPAVIAFAWVAVGIDRRSRKSRD